MPKPEKSGMQPEQLQDKHVVLLGVGHTNAHVVRKWMMQPISGASLTCVSNFLTASYSGMLPAVLAGQVPASEMEIDLVKLCSVAGARLITNPAVGLDPTGQRLLFADRPPMQYDVLSIGIGSRPVLPTVDLRTDSAAARSLKIKPMQSFMQRLDAAIRGAMQSIGGRTIEIAVVGSGAAGVEIACCLMQYLRNHDKGNFLVTLVSRSESVLAGSRAGFTRQVTAALEKSGVRCVTGFEVAKCLQAAESDRLLLKKVGEPSEGISTDIVIWATGATAPPLLGELGLTTDQRGFLKTDAALRCMQHSSVFAVGDSGSFDQHTPKAGVYAVRQGPVLWENIKRTLAGQPTKQFRPQRDFLKLINLGNGRAVMNWRGLSSTGAHAWWLKKRIDVAFLDKYRPEPMKVDSGMQCAGCGCKLGASDLQAALERSGAPGTIEDAVSLAADGQMIASVDFFSCPVRDPFLNGRISLLHAASDIIACGGRPTKALAIVVVPEGAPKRQSEWLAEFLAGAEVELDALGGQLSAGHTIVGPRAEAGFTIFGEIDPGAFLRKSGAQPGDALVLTKPLGTGVALAALSRGLCSAETWQSALNAMLSRQHSLPAEFAILDLHAMTDVTGFGLAGHLLEMLSSSGVAANVNVDSVPAIRGVRQLIQDGVHSSLYESNFASCRSQIQWDVSQDERTKLLFDPQTCGGLLIALPESKAQHLVALCQERGIADATVIGSVESEKCQGEKRLTLRRQAKVAETKNR